MYGNQIVAAGKENMSALEEKVNALMRYCVAESTQLRRYYQGDLQAMLGIVQRESLDSEIDRALSDLGIPDHLLGYRYLQFAIRQALEDPDAVHCVMSRLYPGVARRFGTTAPLVERAIRHAVESGWNRCDETMRRLYFGGKIRPGRQRPTNAEFIARLTNVIKKQ